MLRTKPPPVITQPRSPRAAARPQGNSSDRSGSVGVFDQGTPPRFPLLGLGLIVGGGATGFVLSHQNDFLVGQVASLLISSFALHGLWRGGVRKLVMLPLTFGMLFLFAAKPDFADPLVRAVSGKTSPFGNMLACGMTMIVSFLMVGALLRYIRSRFIMRSSVLTGLDRFLGITIGMAEGAAVMLGICWSSVLTEPQMTALRDHPSVAAGSMRHNVATTFIRISQEIQGSALKPLAGEWNLLKDVPAFRQVLERFGNVNTLNGDPWDVPASAGAIEILSPSAAEKLGELSEAAKRLKDKNEQRNEAYRRMPAPTR